MKEEKEREGDQEVVLEIKEPVEIGNFKQNYNMNKDIVIIFISINKFVNLDDQRIEDQIVEIVIENRERDVGAGTGVLVEIDIGAETEG